MNGGSTTSRRKSQAEESPPPWNQQQMPSLTSVSPGFHLVFTWFSPGFHPAVGGVGASVGGELGSPFQPFFNSMLPLNYKFRRWTVWNASFHFVEYQSLPDSHPVISTPLSTSIEVLFPWAAAPFHPWPRNPIFHWWYFSHQFCQP